MWWFMTLVLATQEVEVGGSLAQGQSWAKAKRAEGLVHVVEHLLSELEALSSNPTTTKEIT
jgi:hypothetical protein